MQVTVATWPSPYPCRRDLPASAVPEEFYFGSIRKPIEEGDDSPQQCRIFCFYFGSIRRQAEEKRLFPLAKRIFFFTWGPRRMLMIPPGRTKYQKWHPPQPAACTIAHDGENLPHLPSFHPACEGVGHRQAG